MQPGADTSEPPGIGSPVDGSRVRRWNVQRTGPSTASTTLADNRRLVLDVLRTSGQLTRTEIGEASGLSPSATARITSALEADRLIAREKLPSAGGRPAWRYRFTAEGRHLAGLRVQGDGCRAALLTWEAEVVTRAEVLVDPATATAEDLLVATRECLAEIIAAGAEHDGSPVVVGVAVPCIVEQDGTVRAGAEVPWDGVPLGAQLSATTDLPVLVENDANALAYSELTPGNGTASLAGLILGHGLGAGIISEGHLLRGAHASAGEIGYLLTTRDALGREPALIGDLERRIQVAAASVPGTPSSAPARLWRLLGEPRAASAVAEMLDYLAMAIASLVVVLDPERVVIADIPPEHTARLGQELEQRLGGLSMRPGVITPARRGQDAVAIGAALLASELVDLQSL
jgi:predicted NBD/HSP70 family sugar kinase